MDLVREVHRARRRRNLGNALSMLLFCLGAVSALGVLLLSVDDLIGSSPILRTFLLLLLSGCVLTGALVSLVFPWCRRVSDRDILRDAEEKDPYFQDRLATAYYLLTEREEVRKFGYSPVLAESLLRWVRLLDSRAAFGKRMILVSIQKSLLVALIPGAIFLLMLLLNRELVGSAFRRYILAPGIQPQEQRLGYISTPGDLRVPRGEAVPLNFSIQGYQEPPRFHLRDRFGNWVTFPMESMTPDLYRVEIGGVDQEYLYFLSVGAFFSEAHRIVPVDPPRIREIKWTIESPEYTGRPVREIPNQRGIEVALGSRAQLSIECDGDLSAVIPLGRDDIPLGVDVIYQANSASFTLDIAGPLVFRLFLMGEMERVSLSDEFRVDVLPDTVPRVRILAPEMTAEIPESGLVDLIAEVRDDYGITEATLVYRMNYEEETHRIPIPFGRERLSEEPVSSIAWTVKADPGNDSLVAAAILGKWDLVPYDMLPGDEISWWIEALDNEPVSGGQRGTSEIRFLRIPSLFEIYEDIEQAEADQARDFADILDRQRRIREEIHETVETLRRERMTGQGSREGQPSWEESRHATELENEQQEIAKDLDSLRESLSETAERLAERMETSMRALEKMERVRELFNELLTQEMKDVILEFQKAVAQYQRDRSLEPLENLEYSLKDFEEELNALLDLLENTRLERELEAAAGEARRLAEAEEKIIERTERAGEGEDGPSKQETDRLALQQDELKARTDILAERLGKLAKELAERGRPEAEAVRETAEDLKKGEVAEALSEAVKALSEQRMEEALAAERTAAEGLQQAAQSLEASHCSMCGGGGFEKDLRALSALIDRSQALSIGQEQVVRGFEFIGGRGRWGSPERKLDFTRDQADLAREAERVRQDFLDFSRNSPFRDFRVARLLEEAGRHMTGAASQAKDHGPPGVRMESRAALGKVNTATQMLLASLSQTQESQRRSGMQGYFQQLRELIERQKRLNEETSRLDQSNRERPSWEDELRRIASEQESIREQLRQLEEQQQRARELLGDFSSVGEDMDEVGERLERGETGEEVQDLQDRIYSRLLDAERSRRRQNTSEERESRTARPGSEEREQAPRTREEIQRRITRPEDRLAEDEVVPRHRDRVRAYFRRLSRQGF